MSTPSSNVPVGYHQVRRKTSGMKIFGERKVATFTNGSDGLRARINDGKWTIATRIVVSGWHRTTGNGFLSDRHGALYISVETHSEEQDLGDLSHSQH